MEYRKYGRFKFSDYCITWVGITFLVGFSIVSGILELSCLFILFPTIYATIWLLVILIPNTESFSLSKNSIRVKKINGEREINIPTDIVVVISYVDICPPLSIRSSIGNQTHILKNKYGISILNKKHLDEVLECLHKNYTQIYTTSFIKNVFNECEYIYSFVFDQELLEDFLSDKECDIIIPESLCEKVKIDKHNIKVYVDKGY